MYVVGRDPKRTNAALKRLDHLICRVPDIERSHASLLELGFPEAWPIGRFWPQGRTSGIGLGGVNLELIQPDAAAPERPICDTLVFEPTSMEAAEEAFGRLGVRCERYEKLESDAELLRLRGFSPEEAQSQQLICTNLFPDPDFPVPMFVCQYSHGLGRRLSHAAVGESSLGPVIGVEVQMEKAGQLGALVPLGYLGSVELRQREDVSGPFRVTGIQLQKGALPLEGSPLGFDFI